MDYVTEPNFREMFFYLMIAGGMAVFFALALLSPVIVGEIIRAFRK